MLKKSLILLTVLSFAVVANGALPVGVEMMSSGDMENGGDATTPPLYWSDTGTGTVGVSSDTPSGSGQSLEVTGDETPGYDYGKYSHDYTDQSGYALGTQIAYSYDLKGDVYTSMYQTTGTVYPGPTGYTTISGDGLFQWERLADWTHYEGVLEVTDGGCDGFSFYVYDNSGGPGNTLNSAMADNVSFKVIPEPATMTLIGLGGLALIRRRK